MYVFGLWQENMERTFTVAVKTRKLDIERPQTNIPCRVHTFRRLQELDLVVINGRTISGEEEEFLCVTDAAKPSETQKHNK